MSGDLDPIDAYDDLKAGQVTGTYTGFATRPGCSLIDKPFPRRGKSCPRDEAANRLDLHSGQTILAVRPEIKADFCSYSRL
jgi:hypothetical protein